MRVSGQFYVFTKKFDTHEKHKNAYKWTKTKKAALNALKKHLRGRNSLVHLYAFLCFLCAFCAFLCVKQKRQYFYAHKKHLRRRKSLDWRFVLFMLYMRIKNIWVKVTYLRFVLFVYVKSFRKKIKLPWYPHLYYYEIHPFLQSFSIITIFFNYHSFS